MLLSVFSNAPAPTSPASTTRVENDSGIQRSDSIVSGPAPTMVVRVPFSAPTTPPVTGASMYVTPERRQVGGDRLGVGRGDAGEVEDRQPARVRELTERVDDGSRRPTVGHAEAEHVAVAEVGRQLVDDGQAGRTGHPLSGGRVDVGTRVHRRCRRLGDVADEMEPHPPEPGEHNRSSRPAPSGRRSSRRFETVRAQKPV